MHKDQKEELERLEAALMEMDQPEPEEDMDQWLEDLFDDEEDYVESYNVYTTDDADVELDESSQDVHEGRRGGGCLVPLLLFLTLVLCALVGF